MLLNSARIYRLRFQCISRVIYLIAAFVLILISNTKSQAETLIESELKQSLYPLATHLSLSARHLVLLERDMNRSVIGTETDRLHRFEYALNEIVKPLPGLQERIWRLEGIWLNRLGQLRINIASFGELKPSEIHDRHIAELDKSIETLSQLNTAEARRRLQRFKRRRQVIEELIWIDKSRQSAARQGLTWKSQEYELLAGLCLVLGDLSSQLYLLNAHLENLRSQTHQTYTRHLQQKKVARQQRLTDIKGIPRLTQSLLEINRSLKQMQQQRLTAILVDQTSLKTALEGGQ